MSPIGFRKKHFKKRNVFLKVKLIIDWIESYTLSAKFKTCNGGINDESFDINQNVNEPYNLASEALKQLESNNALGHVSG